MPFFFLFIFPKVNIFLGSVQLLRDYGGAVIGFGFLSSRQGLKLWPRLASHLRSLCSVASQVLGVQAGHRSVPIFFSNYTRIWTHGLTHLGHILQHGAVCEAFQQIVYEEHHLYMDSNCLFHENVRNWDIQCNQNPWTHKRKKENYCWMVWERGPCMASGHECRDPRIYHSGSFHWHWLGTEGCTPAPALCAANHSFLVLFSLDFENDLLSLQLSNFRSISAHIFNTYGQMLPFFFCTN